jgi:hypothetical protein
MVLVAEVAVVETRLLLVLVLQAVVVEETVVLELQVLQTLVVAVVAVEPLLVVRLVVLVMQELYFGLKEINYGTTLCIS